MALTDYIILCHYNILLGHFPILWHSADKPNADAHLEQGELAHLLVKRLYGRTNKCDATRQIGQHIRWLECARNAADRHWLKTRSEMRGVNIEENTDQNLDKQYHMSNSWNNPVSLYPFVRENQDDPVFKAFIPKLKDHILGHLLRWEYKGNMYGDTEFMDDKQNTVQIASEWIYRCKTIQINYMTYDIRCDADTINTRTYLDVMVTSPETGPNAQPYWYAHVIGIFHAIVSSTHPELEGMAQSRTHMDFLWVR